MYFLKRLIVIVLVQLLIFSFIFTLFVFSFNQRREVSKNQSKALASVIAEQASNYFEENNNNFSSKDFFNFLDDQIGVQKLTNAFNVNPPELLTVYFRSDIMKGIVNAGTDDNLNKDDDSPFNNTNKFFFNNKKGRDRIYLALSILKPKNDSYFIKIILLVTTISADSNA